MIFKEESKFFQQGKFAKTGVVVIGTTSECSAMCPCCPKDRATRGVMSMPLWESITDQIMTLTFWFPNVGIGLFGESLQDPYLLKRVQYFQRKREHWTRRLRKMSTLPKLNITTNAHFLIPTLAEELIKYVDTFTVHIESHQPDLYQKLMPKLDYYQVISNINYLLKINKTWKKDIAIALPLHKLNYHQKVEMEEFWLERGVNRVDFFGFSNRGGDLKTFNKMSVTQFVHHGWCHGEVLADLVIDWDGAILLCCQDFRHDSLMANVKNTSIRDLMLSKQRQELHMFLENEQWEQIPICSNCKWQEIKLDEIKI